MATVFADRYRWEFVEVDAIKRKRHETATDSDDEDFLEAGRQARAALDGGTDVIAEEFFNWERYIDLFLQPTGLTILSPNFVAVRLDCDVDEAARRKTGMDVGVLRRAHGVLSQRYVLPGEIVLETTSQTAEEVVNRVAGRLIARGLTLVEKASG